MYLLFACALVVTFGGLVINDILTPTIPFNWTWETIGKVAAIGVVISWVIHGVQVKLLA